LDIFQIILLLNICVAVGFFIISMITLKVWGVDPMGKREKTDNIFGVLAIIISTLILFGLWISYIINPNISLLFLSIRQLTILSYIKWIAVSLITIATIMEIVSGLTLGKSGRIHTPTEKTKLIKTGIYGVIRNPVVFGLFLYGLGILLLNPNLLSLFMIILLVYGYNFKVDTEAKKLKEMFGDQWDEYCKKVGKYFPRLFTRLK
jgi:protein-S-isoprenylcysteine O-methyltransferase Ste14